VLLSVMLGMREAHEDWLALGRDLIARDCWPASDRQHRAVHRMRNLLAELPERERERVRQAYWRACLPPARYCTRCRRRTSRQFAGSTKG
jgi:hypothetical protein